VGIEEKVQILVAEDGEVFRRNISAGLRVLGYRQITCVSNGQAALDFLLVNPVDLVISDWYMEPVSGLDLVRWVRGDPGRNNMAFLMLSGESAKEKVIEAVRAGIDGYVVKPFTVNMLGAKIQDALKKRNLIK
jgi:two-component system chemotaxis response regulator CheY